MSAYKVILPAQAAAAADVTTLIEAVAGAQQLSEVVVTAPPGTTVTGAATNNFTISVRQINPTNGAATVFASLVLGAGVVINPERPVRIPFTAASTRGNRFALTPDAALDVLLHQNGTGLAVPAGLVVEVETAGGN